MPACCLKPLITEEARLRRQEEEGDSIQVISSSSKAWTLISELKAKKLGS